MKTFSAIFAGALAACALVAPALAADLPVYEAPQPVYEAPAVGGWYIRGDIDYHWSKLRGIDYITYGVDDCDPCGPIPVPGSKSFDSTKLKGAMSLGAGVGYQITNHFRADVTADYWFKSRFNGSTSDLVSTSEDESSYRAWVLLANAYADLGTWHRITPYIGAGIGGAHIKWDDLHNTIDEDTTHHKGSKNWRFAYALMAGASYCINQNLSFDAGYRYTRVEDGRMFEEAGGAGPGFDKGFNVHEVRGGLRYQFGGGRPDCGAPEPVAYEPEPLITK